VLLQVLSYLIGVHVSNDLKYGTITSMPSRPKQLRNNPDNLHFNFLIAFLSVYVQFSSLQLLQAEINSLSLIIIFETRLSRVVIFLVD